MVTSTDLLTELVRQRRLVALIFFVVVGVGVAYMFLATPIYRVQAVLIPAESSFGTFNASAAGALGSLASMAGVEVGQRDTETVEALALLKSRRFSTEFIRDRNLLPVLFADRWDAQSKSWREASWIAIGQGAPTEERAFEYFDSRIRSIAQDRKTQLVTLTIDWKDRNAAVDWANELIRRLNEEMRLRAIAESTASLARLEEQIVKTNIMAVQESLAQLIEREVKRRTVALTRVDYVFRVIDPPVAPDADNPESPKRWFVLVFSILVAILASAIFILSSAVFRNPESHDH